MTCLSRNRVTQDGDRARGGVYYESAVPVGELVEPAFPVSVLPIVMRLRATCGIAPFLLKRLPGRPRYCVGTIRARLGHVSLGTTNMHAEIDPALKANAAAQCEIGRLGPGRSWKEDRDLTAIPKGIIQTV